MMRKAFSILFFGVSVAAFSGCANDDTGSQTKQERGGGIDTSVEYTPSSTGKPYGDFFCNTQGQMGGYIASTGEKIPGTPPMNACMSLLPSGDPSNLIGDDILIVYGGANVKADECKGLKEAIPTENGTEYLAFVIDYEMKRSKSIPGLTYIQTIWTNKKVMTEVDSKTFVHGVYAKISAKSENQPYKYLMPGSGGKTFKAAYKVHTGDFYEHNLSHNTGTMIDAMNNSFYCNTIR